MSVNIYMDLETGPTTRPELIERATADVRPPAQYKKADSIEKWWAENGEAEKAAALAKTSLNGGYGELLTIGFAVNDGPVIVLARADVPDGEQMLLDMFAIALADNARAQAPDHGDWWGVRACWIGHNIEDFDLRFLWQRSRVLGVHLPFPLPLERYAKTPSRYDTMKEWGGWQNRIRQQDLELILGLTRDDAITGADVAEHWARGDIETVVNHCKEDVRLLREIHRRLTA